MTPKNPGIDTGKLLSPQPGKTRGAKSLAKALDGFRREAAEKNTAELLKPNDAAGDDGEDDRRSLS